MGIETHTKKIDGREFLVTTFPARKSIALLSRLLALLGPGFAEGIKSLNLKDGRSIMDQDVNTEVAGALLQQLLSRIDESNVLALVLDMLRVGNVIMIRDGEGAKPVKVELGTDESAFDKEFAGELFTLSKLLAFVLSVNYKDFFAKSGIFAALPRLSTPRVPPEQGESLKTPTS
jgi:hypothetical protein